MGVDKKMMINTNDKPIYFKYRIRLARKTTVSPIATLLAECGYGVGGYALKSPLVIKHCEGFGRLEALPTK